MLRVGMSSCAFQKLSPTKDEYVFKPESFEKLSASGIEAVELSIECNFKVDAKHFSRLARDNGIALWSCHLPYFPFEEMDISIPDKTVRKKTFELLSELVRKISDLGVDKFVIHPSTPIPESADRNERKLCSMDMLNEIAEVADKNGAIICAEDMIPSCLGNSAEELLEIISVNDKIRVCFDVNHLLNNTHEEFISILDRKIATLHISDYDFIQERHWFPGEGKIDWPALYSMLRKHGYDGVWMHELGLSSRDGLRGRELTFDDFYNASHQIFNGKKPSIDIATMK